MCNWRNGARRYPSERPPTHQFIGAAERNRSGDGNACSATTAGPIPARTSVDRSPVPVAQRMPSAVRWLAVLLGVVIAEVISGAVLGTGVDAAIAVGRGAAQYSEVAALSARLDRFDAAPGRLDKVEALAPRLIGSRLALRNSRQCGKRAAAQQFD